MHSSLVLYTFCDYLVLAMKSCKEAVSLKEKGNTCFKEKKTAESLKVYTQAIFYAPWPHTAQQKRAEDIKTSTRRSKSFPVVEAASSESDNAAETILAVLYGNHSAALYELEKYQDCLKDIKMALKLGVKSTIEQKLLRRQRNCYAQLKATNPYALKDARKQDVKECSVFASKHVCVKSSAELGRFVQTTKAVEAGKVLATESPFASQLDEQFKLTHCGNCFREAVSIIPCYWCKTEGYCSERCLDDDWKRYHWAECKRVSVLRSVWPQAQLCLRIAAQFTSGDYKTVFSLITHKEEVLKNSTVTEMFERIAGQLVALFGDAVQSASLPSKERFIHHMLQIRFNIVGVSSLVISGSGQPPTTGPGDNLQEVNQVKFGDVLYPTLSLVNHSCQPNTILRFAGNRASLVATRPIKAGEEVTICYGPRAGRDKRSKRQTQLKDTYLFNCACTACKNPAHEVQDAFLCTQCSGPLITCHSDSTLVSCALCKYTPSSTQLAHQTKMRRKAIEMTQKAVRRLPINLPLLIESCELLSQVLHENNLELSGTKDMLAQVYAMQGDFATSARYCAASCRALGVAYGDDSIELGNELFKLAQLYFNGKDWHEALKVARRARTTLVVYYGTSHEQCEELKYLIKTIQLPKPKI